MDKCLLDAVAACAPPAPAGYERLSVWVEGDGRTVCAAYRGRPFENYFRLGIAFADAASLVVGDRFRLSYAACSAGRPGEDYDITLYVTLLDPPPAA